MHDRGLEAQNVIGIPVAPRSAQCGRADNIGHHDRERIGGPAAIRQRLPPIQLLKPRTCPSEYGGLRTQLASHVRAGAGPATHQSRSCPASPGYRQRVGRSNVRPPLQAFGLGGVAGHPKGAIGRQRLVEQLGGLLLVSPATTVEQHPGSQAA